MTRALFRFRSKALSSSLHTSYRCHLWTCFAHQRLFRPLGLHRLAAQPHSLGRRRVVNPEALRSPHESTDKAQAPNTDTHNCHYSCKNVYEHRQNVYQTLKMYMKHQKCISTISLQPTLYCGFLHFHIQIYIFYTILEMFLGIFFSYQHLNLYIMYICI